MNDAQAALLAASVYASSGAVPWSAEQVEARAADHLRWLNRNQTMDAPHAV